MKRLTLAIDPGASGGFAWILAGHPARSAPMPERWGEVVSLIQSLRREDTERVAYIEDLVKFMGGGGDQNLSSTMAVYGASWGFIFGCLRMDGWAVTRVKPQEWQKALGLGITGRQRADVRGLSKADAAAEKLRVRRLNGNLKTAWKAKLRDEAQRLFPHLNVTLKTADALLILAYASASRSPKAEQGVFPSVADTGDRGIVPV